MYSDITGACREGVGLQGYQQQLAGSMPGNAFGFSSAAPVHQANMMDQLSAQFAQLSTANQHGLRNAPRGPYSQQMRE